MSKTLKFLTMSGAAASLSVVAYAQAIGTVTSMTGDLGQVIVERGGSTFSLSPGDPIFEGDIITTRADGSAVITSNGVTTSIPASSTASVTAAGVTAPTTVAAAGGAAGGAGGGVVAGAGGAAGAGAGAGGLVLGGLAAAGVVGAVASSGGDDSPSSP